MKKILVSLVAMMFLAVPMAFAVSVQDATANGEFADFYSTTSGLTGSADELAFVNSVWGVTNPFFYIGKDEEQVGGWLLTVTPGNYTVNGIDYGFEYTVSAPDAWVGSVVDFVLGVKQPTGQGFDYVAYLFYSVTLDIDGTFNSYGPGSGELDYSHISGFIRGTQQVPEPTTLLLFGAGIAGLALYRRKRS
jgi:hypothetical protein